MAGFKPFFYGFLFLALALGTVFFVYLAWAFIKNYRKSHKRDKNPTQVGFVVDTFHSLVAQLKEKERELESLRKTAEERADLAQNLSENILESVASGVISMDEDGRITKVNSRAEKILEFKREDALGKLHSEILGPPLTEYLIKGETVERGEINYRTPSGRTLWLGFSITPLLDNNGDKDGQILVFTDLTELKMLERQAELRKRLSSLGEMSAGVAHELRNPMAVISGYAQMLSKDLPDNLKPASLAMEKEIQCMNSIINGFLSFAKPKEPVFSELTAKDLIRENLSGKEIPSNVEISISTEPSDFTFKGDAVLLRQAFTNLIGNALEAMPEGGKLTIKAEKEEREVLFKISDTGHGIPEGLKEKIFLPFYTTKEKGTGLGLAIVHSIIQSHGGAIEAESSERGASFTVRLPLR
jgi:PAS domain S-box-containing protein